MNPDMENRFKRAREIIENGDYFRILTHYDVDGVCSAGIVAKYLLQHGKNFHISFFRNAESSEIINIVNNEDYVILTDLGSSFVAKMKGDVIVLDHHKPPADNEEIVHINPHIFGYDGAHDACASTLAYYLTEDPRIARFALAGIFGDKQHLGGFTGLNLELLDSMGIRPQENLVLHGEVLDAVVYSTEPFFPGLSGKPEVVGKILEKLKISPTKKIEELSEEEKVKLGSYLSLVLVRESQVPEAGRFIVGMDVDMGGSVRYLTELLDSAARSDEQSVALGYILGEDGNLERMEILRKRYKSEVINNIYEMLNNYFTRGHVIYFFAPNGYLTSSLATIASLYLFPPDRVIVGIYVDAQVHISVRCSKYFARKFHLGEILREICAFLGGQGGGHSVAAGCTLPKGKEEEFLELLNEKIEKGISQ